jgi:hypothetical protein
MSWNNLTSYVVSKGMSLEDAWVDGALLSGYVTNAFGSEIARLAGKGSQAIFIRGAVAVGLHVAKKLETDFGLGKQISDITRCQDMVMSSVLMPHKFEQSDDGNAVTKVFDCPYATLVSIQGDPMVCEFCVGYTRGACDRVGSIGFTRVAHIPSGDKECVFEFKKNGEHGLSQYRLVKSIPSPDYVSHVIPNAVKTIKDNFVSYISSNAKPLLSPPASSEEERKMRALAYIIDLSSRVIGGLVMNEALNATSILGDAMINRISDSSGRMAAGLAMNGFPPFAIGWKKKYGISNGKPEARRVASFYLVSTKHDGKVNDQEVEIKRCVWFDMIKDMIQAPDMYHLSRFSDPDAEKRAIKAGCRSCDSCLRTLIKSTGTDMEQVTCKADGTPTCTWRVK